MGGSEPTTLVIVVPLLMIAPAAPADWPAALDLLFQHLPPDVRRQRCVSTQTLLETGELLPAGLRIARHDGRIAAVLICLPLKGNSALFWPPQVAPDCDPVAVLDPLIRHTLDWLQSLDTKLAQAFVATVELPLVAPLLRCGFRHITQLDYFHHDLSSIRGTGFLARPADSPGNSHDITEGLRMDGLGSPSHEIECYQPANQQLFHDTLLRSYEGGLDCPELNGRRSIEEIVEGHQHQGAFRPEWWWLARAQGQPVGVVILSEVPGWQGWELSYVGVVPEARRQGIGAALTLRALDAVRQTRAHQLSVAVDARNQPARQLYEKLGFVHDERREVLLFFFADLAEDTG